MFFTIWPGGIINVNIGMTCNTIISTAIIIICITCVIITIRFMC